MIAFMVIGLGRCGTTWAANWLTSGGQVCRHDPARLAKPEEWDARFAGEGIACTAAWLWPEWVNAHPARKVILHRPLAEVAGSFHRLGLPLPVADARVLDRIDGLHAEWTDLFEPQRARAIWAHLTDEPFDAKRHAVLRQMNVQPHFPALSVEPAAVRSLAAKISGHLARSA